MKEISQEALKGEQFLLDNRERYRLEMNYYSFDKQAIRFVLLDIGDQMPIPLDGSDIFRQVYEYISKKPKLYKLTLDGQDFTGTAADVARHYCLEEGIKLYIEPNQDNYLTLYAKFCNDGNTVADIAPFKDGTDIEGGYRLFFTKYMLKARNPDFTIAELD